MYSLEGKAVLEHILDRLALAKRPKNVIVATSTDVTDDPIEELAVRKGFCVFRGSLKNVLSRYYHAAQHYGVKHVMRICADNPFVDPNLIDAGIDHYAGSSYQYMTCEHVPVGLGYWITPFSELERAYQNAKEPDELEHVMPYIAKSAEQKGFYRYPKDFSQYYLTMDTPKDWTHVQAIYHGLYHGTHDFFLEDIVQFIDASRDGLNYGK